MVDGQSTPTVALAHDWLVGLRGGEWVLDRLARMYGPTDLYALVASGVSLTPAIDACTVTTSPLQRFPGAAGRLRRYYLPLMPWAVGRLQVQPCDLLFSTSSAVMKSIRPPRGTPHLCYCHSPARYIWEQRSDYAIGAGGGLRSLGLRLVQRRFQRWDRQTAQRVTRFLCNSRHTAERIRRCYDRTAHVVYPPVDTEYFQVDPSVQRQPWLLVVAALEPYKRTDLAIRAANAMELPLKVAGVGSQFNALRSLAGPTVEMLGRVSRAELRALYQQAAGLIFPQLEDFGIVAVEAQACGCPVIASAAGGALETVTESTGVFFDHAAVSSLIAAIEQFHQREFDARMIRENAQQFRMQRFDQQVAGHAEQLLGGHWLEGDVRP